MDPYQYSYTVPKDLIAHSPVEPRDSARLFVYDTATDTIEHTHVRDIGTHIHKHTLMVLNDTRVVPARVTMYKRSGGKVVLLFLFNEWKGGGSISVLSDRRLHIGEVVSTEDKVFHFTVRAQHEQKWELSHDYERKELLDFLDRYGQTPLPPYIRSNDMSEHDLRSRYQSVLADREGSVAAPTASLHFTESLLKTLSEHGIGSTHVTLDVGLGTFAPLRQEQLDTNTLHTEWIDVSQESAKMIRAAKNDGRPICAVGTTVCRTLESAAPVILQGEEFHDATTIFIRPGYHFRVVDMLTTNFHVPESSLMMLVQAFLVHKGSTRSLVSLYEEAIGMKYRFFSFGDTMLIR